MKRKIREKKCPSGTIFIVLYDPQTPREPFSYVQQTATPGSQYLQLYTHSNQLTACFSQLAFCLPIKHMQLCTQLKKSKVFQILTVSICLRQLSFLLTSHKTVKYVVLAPYIDSHLSLKIAISCKESLERDAIIPCRYNPKYDVNETEYGRSSFDLADISWLACKLASVRNSVHWI